MTAHPSRLPFALLLVAEAKRRMRRRRLLALALLALLAGCAIGGWFALQPASPSHFVATQPVRSAFAKQDMTASWGRPSSGLDTADELRFVPSARFALGIALTNEASQPVTLTDVRAVLPRGSVMRQLGTALVAYNPPACPAGERCPPPGGPLQPPYGAIRPSPLPVAPGTGAGIQLNFQFLGCPQARHGSLRNVSRIELTYRDGVGAIIRQRVGWQRRRS